MRAAVTPPWVGEGLCRQWKRMSRTEAFYRRESKKDPHFLKHSQSAAEILPGVIFFLNTRPALPAASDH